MIAHRVRTTGFNTSVSPTREQLTALSQELNTPRCTAARITSFLRTWKL